MNSTNKGIKQDTNSISEIIDDVGLISYLNVLNEAESGKLSAANALQVQQGVRVTNMRRFKAEMRWFSQWLTVKTKSAA